MAGFIRRYGFFPGTEVITQIEGVIIVDLPPPGSIAGVQTGVVGVVGEFQNAQFACAVDSSGVASARIQPVEIFSSQDLIDKSGGFDETIGAFGVGMGNGFVEIRNKKFARLVVIPIDNITPAAGTQGTVRIWRELPTNSGPASVVPIVPVSPAQVPVGRQFVNGANRLRLASVVSFSDAVAYATGTDGSVTAAAPALTNPFDAVTGDFVNRGVAEGDLLVVGQIGGAAGLGSNARTYRVVSVTDADTLVVQRLDGASFAWVTTASLPWRLHVRATGDSISADGVGHQFSEGGGYSILARPLTATMAVGQLLTPSVVPAAPTGAVWEPLSGLGGAVHPTAALTYDANVHAPNAANNATLDARYQAALDATLNDEYPARDLNILVAARKSSAIRSKLKSNVQVASERGLTRRAILSPEVNQASLTTVIGSADPGVGANRVDRLDYSWPALRTSIPEAVGFTIVTSDAKTTTDGVLDVTADTWLASVESNLPPERNPGQAAQPVPTILAPVLAFARGMPKLGMPEYTSLRTFGVCAPRFDKTVGPIFQSGVTTSLVSGEKNIMRRRMADFIQDSIAQRLVQLCKLPLSEGLKDSSTAEVVSFMEELLSRDNAAARRINAYEIDDKSGNTEAREAAGIFVIIVRVRLTPTADFIVIQSEIGEGVVINTLLAA